MTETKQVAATHRVFVTDALVEKGYQRMLDGTDFVAQAASLERHGGECPVCGASFKKLIINNRYGDFAYFQPACWCFKVCREVRVPSGTVEGCGRFLIAEYFAGIDYCTACYREESRPAARTATGYRTARKTSGKDAAVGDEA